MDLPSVHDGTQVVVIHEEQGAPTQAVFTAAGMIGLMGVNSAGVGVCVNNLDVLPAARSGVPVTFIERKILDTFSVEEAGYALHAMPHTIGQHYLIGDPTGLVSYEADAARVIGGSDELRVVAHANHPIYDPPAKPELEAVYAASNTRNRMSCMAALTEGATIVDRHRGRPWRYQRSDQPRARSWLHDAWSHGCRTHVATEGAIRARSATPAPIRRSRRAVRRRGAPVDFCVVPNL